jgi:TPR repeat protein
MFNYAMCVEKGQGFEQDSTSAVRLSQMGHMNAMLNCDTCFERGDRVEKDMVSTALYCKRAADLDHLTAAFNCGTCLDVEPELRGISFPRLAITR